MAEEPFALSMGCDGVNRALWPFVRRVQRRSPLLDRLWRGIYALATGRVLFYRAVCTAEYEQLLRTRRFACLRGHVPGKYLAETRRAAEGWGEWNREVAVRLEGREEPHIVVRLSVPKADAHLMTCLGFIDGTGVAWFASLDQLEHAILEL